MLDFTYLIRLQEEDRVLARRVRIVRSIQLNLALIRSQ